MPVSHPTRLPDRQRQILARTRDRIIEVLAELRGINCDLLDAEYVPPGAEEDIAEALIDMVDVLCTVQLGLETRR